MTNKKNLQEWLRAAYGDGSGCPPPEVFLADEWAALETTRRQELDNHLAECPACSAELELARAFDDTNVDSEDARWVVGQLERARVDGADDHSGEMANVVAYQPGRWRQRSRFLVPLAAAATIVLGVGLTLQLRQPEAPPLPDRPSGGAIRGSVVDVMAPIGELESAPELVEWREVEGAVTYRFVLMGVDDEVLWESRFESSPGTIPTSQASQFKPGVVYSWQLEGLSEGGEILAQSAKQQFRLRPNIEE